MIVLEWLFLTIDAAEPWQLGFQDAATPMMQGIVDNRVVVPDKTHIRIIVTPADVPHSWAVPSSGVKCDAVPGRLNQISIEAVPRKDYGSRVVPDRSPMAASPMEPRLSPWDLLSGANREPSPFCGSQMEVAGPSNPRGGSAPPLPIESGTVPPANAVTLSEAGPSQVAPPGPSFLIPPDEVSQDALWGALEDTARSLMQSRAYRATDRALGRFYSEQNELATLLAGMLPQRGIVANAEDVRRAVSALTYDIYDNYEGRPKRMRALKNSLINRPEGKAWRDFIQHLRELGVPVNADDWPSE
uniref:Cytochrome c oxidase polypeptide II n=1 Tax=Eriobotrya japonica TaxID=32224 RepID=A0A5Q3A9C4_9ROSA|nr:hypothetical protein [Eriobotrya japonica]QGI24992.1 hypothetical protein [Eriobotrya japonica]